MRTREKAALAVAGLAVAAAGGTAFAGTSGAVGPSPVPSVQAAETSCVTDGAGMCTVQHALGAVPAVVVVSANTPGQRDGPVSPPTTQTPAEDVTRTDADNAQ